MSLVSVTYIEAVCLCWLCCVCFVYSGCYWWSPVLRRRRLMDLW